ncbi:MAG: hypothetical protein HQK54_06200 [Oligoflexales bacterium]|nr:hypothetical protein [Oligoflexales bacterium]
MEYTQIVGDLDPMRREIVSLELSLENMKKAGCISARDYSVRMEGIKGLHSRIARIQLLLSSDRSFDSGIDLGIPDLDEVSQEEMVICDRFLTERLNLGRSVYESLTSLLHWVAEASRGKGGGLKAIFRLSKIKKMIREIEKESRRQTREEEILHGRSKKLLGRLKSMSGGNYMVSNVKALMKLFKELDSLSNRIVKLKSIVSIEENKIREMREWLAGNDVCHERIPNIRPPTYEDIDELRFNLPCELDDPLRYVENNIAMVRDFIESQRSRKERKEETPEGKGQGDRKTKGRKMERIIIGATANRRQVEL